MGKMFAAFAVVVLLGISAAAFTGHMPDGRIEFPGIVLIVMAICLAGMFLAVSRRW